MRRGKIFNLIKKVILFFSFSFCIFNLTSCTTTEKRSYNSDFQVVSCVYYSENNETKITWYSNISNESIYNIKKVYFKFDLYKDDTFIKTSDYFIYDIKVGSGESISGNKRFTVEGQIDNIILNEWKADFATFWETYESWFIRTIIGVAILLLALIVFFFFNEGDLSDIDYEWLIGILVILAIPLISSGITSWISSNWVPVCIVLGGLFTVAIILGLIAFAYFLIDEFNLHLIEGKYVALTILGLAIVSGFVCGCIFWKWWACLLIFLCVCLFIGIVILLSKLLKKAILKYKSKKGENIEEGDAITDEEGNKINTPKVYKSEIGFDQIAGLEEAKELFKQKVILPFLHPEIYQKFGKKAGGGLLLYGLPGTGKTMFAEAASKELNATFISVKCSDIKSKWYGESEKKVKAIFAKARRNKKAIIFFDEFEAIGAKRTDDGNNPNNDLVPSILAEMQGVGSSKNDCALLVIAATNKPWAIDSAFMRPGRFDEKIYIPLPDFKARQELFKIQLSKLPVANDLDFNYLANITDGFNGADIKEVCGKLKMSAIKKSLNKGEESQIGMDDVKNIEGLIKSSVSKEDIAQLEAFEKENL